MGANPVVHTAAGAVEGRWRAGSAAFLGIPFAQPPVGELRWAAPVPTSPWEGIRDASEYGATPQRHPFGMVTAIPEPSYPGPSTLNVNVFTPAPGDTAAKLPVFVWLHGGGFKAGSPNSPWYDGKAFNRNGVVTVSVSYRLGFEGFGVIDGCPDNRGLRDQICALEWVRDNIAAFGGDPGNVTIGGQSAGGYSVLALMASPLAQGLFHAGIAQSAPVEGRPIEQARAWTAQLAHQLNVEPTAPALGAPSEDAIYEATEAISLPMGFGFADPVDLVNSFFGPDSMGLAFVPVIGDEVQPASIRDGLAAGRGAVPLLMGCTFHEFDLFGSFLGSQLGDVDVVEILRASCVGDLADEIRDAVADLPDAFALGHVNTIASFRAAVPRIAAVHEGPTWAYDMRYRGVQPDGSRGLAAHCSELPFTFDCLDSEPDYVVRAIGVAPPPALLATMHGDWVRFITTHALPWRPWDADGIAMHYDEESVAGQGYQVEARLVQRDAAS